jgi:hypothetical protein
VTVVANDCIFAKNGGIVFDIPVTTATLTFTSHMCTYVDNTGDCLKIGNSSAAITLELDSNIAYNNTGSFINNATAQQATDANTRINRNNCLGSNSGGNYANLAPGQGDQALSADPFTNRTNRDYSLNNTAGGGAVCRGAAFPASYGGVPDTLNFRDAGATNHTPSAGGATSIFTTRRVIVRPQYHIARSRTFRVPSQILQHIILRQPPRQIPKPYIVRRSIVAALIASPPAILPLRTVKRHFTTVRTVRRNPGASLFAQNLTVNQTILVTSPRKVR